MKKLHSPAIATHDCMEPNRPNRVVRTLFNFIGAMGLMAFLIALYCLSEYIGN